jgi:hypothetical protein
LKNKGTCLVSIWVSKQYPGLPISLGIIFEKCSPVMHKELATYLLELIIKIWKIGKIKSGNLASMELFPHEKSFVIC